MRIGAHVSSAGGISKSIDRAVDIGAETIQIFCSPPQGWAYKPPLEEEVLAFRQKSEETGILPSFLHGIYLMNFGSPDAGLLAKSKGALANYMECAAQIGAEGVIFHSGSHMGQGFEAVLPQTIAALREVLAAAPKGPHLLIENCAGMGNHIGASFTQIGRIMDGIDSPRVKVCLDTQHSFAAGYDVSQTDTLNEAMAEFDAAIGLSNLVAVHANDAKTPFASGVDRHANIGEGHIGDAGFAVIMAHPAFRDVPFLLETPGEGKGPDLAQIEHLKAIRDTVGAAL